MIGFKEAARRDEIGWDARHETLPCSVCPPASRDYPSLCPALPSRSCRHAETSYSSGSTARQLTRNLE